MPEILTLPPSSLPQSGSEPVQHETKSATNSHVIPSDAAPHDSHQESAANASSLNPPVVLQDSAEEAVQQSAQLWAACAGAMAELAGRIEKLPDSKTRDDLHRRLRECSATREKAAQTADVIARRAAIAKYGPEGVKLDRQLRMKQELARANTQVFQQLQKQMCELNDAVCKAHMPTGPLKSAIGTLIAATLAMLAAALASLVVPPLMVAAVAGGVALVGTGSIASLAVASWRNDSKALADLQTAVAAMGSDLQSLIEEAVASRSRAIELFEAAAVSALKARADEVGIAAARTLMEVSVGDAKAKFQRDDTWDGSQYTVDGKPLLSDADLARLKQEQSAADSWIAAVQGRLAALGETDAAPDGAGMPNKLETAERHSARQQLQDALDHRDGIARPVWRAQAESVVQEKSKGNEMVEQALYHALSPRLEQCLWVAMTRHLGARIGLEENTPHPPIFQALEDPVVQTDVRLEGNDSVIARVTLVVPTQADGGLRIGLAGNIGPALVHAGELMRGEAVLRIQGGRCTVTSLDIDISDGVLKVASDVCAADIKLAMTNRLGFGDGSADPPEPEARQQAARDAAGKPVARAEGGRTDGASVSALAADGVPAKAAARKQNAPQLSGLIGSALLFAFASSSNSVELVKQCEIAVPLLTESTHPAKESSPVELARGQSGIRQEADRRATDLAAWADEQLKRFVESTGWKADASAEHGLAEANQWLKRLAVLRATLLQADRQLLSRAECEQLMNCFDESSLTAEQLNEALAPLLRSSDINAAGKRTMEATLRQRLRMVDEAYGQLNSYLIKGTRLPDFSPASAGAKPSQRPGQVTALV
ncbi:hypothetical protein [Paracidovorax citrulli]